MINHSDCNLFISNCTTTTVVILSMLSPRQPSAPFTCRIPYDLQFSILKDLDIDTLIRLRRTCHLADEWVSIELCKRLRHLLQCFIKQPNRFYRYMRSTSVIISGNSTLFVFYPHLYIDSPTLTLYAPHNTFVQVKGYLQRVEGYEPRPLDPTSALNQVRGAFKVTLLRSGTNTIILHQSTRNCPLPPILSSPLTAQQGYISYSSFCMPYPTLTRQKRAVINPLYVDQDPDEVQIDRFNEAWSWEDAGWDIGELPSAWEDLRDCMGPRSALCASAPRYFGDKYCTFGKLDTVRPSRFAVPFVPTLESIQTVY